MKIYNKSYCFQIIYSFTQTTYDKLMQNFFFIKYNYYNIRKKG